ncbi:hypothetical protein [Streptomyces sp. NRRL B-24484]|uniref:hypothetical protein n=1 Tax=Streptomyces sp. NRRL B-24484 TaxID=1463833 RepID=UPI000A5F2DC8|nr:hypothetical protein [Streptomyces sp. NRRL B-24484]
MAIRKFISAALVAGTVVTAGLASAGSASALTADCQGGQVCLYYNSSAHGYGAVYIETTSIENYAGLTFKAGKNGSAGAGVAVKNNAAAVDNHWYGTFNVFYNSGWDCSVACQPIPMNTHRDLNAQLKNNNASGELVGP